nr:hypothetical protein [Spirosoma aureum]
MTNDWYVVGNQQYAHANQYSYPDVTVAGDFVVQQRRLFAGIQVKRVD